MYFIGTICDRSRRSACFEYSSTELYFHLIGDTKCRGASRKPGCIGFLTLFLFFSGSLCLLDLLNSSSNVAVRL